MSIPFNFLFFFFSFSAFESFGTWSDACISARSRPSRINTQQAKANLCESLLLRDDWLVLFSMNNCVISIWELGTILNTSRQYTHYIMKMCYIKWERGRQKYANIKIDRLRCSFWIRQTSALYGLKPKLLHVWKFLKFLNIISYCLSSSILASPSGNRDKAISWKETIFWCFFHGLSCFCSPCVWKSSQLAQIVVS